MRKRIGQALFGWRLSEVACARTHLGGAKLLVADIAHGWGAGGRRFRHSQTVEEHMGNEMVE